jgi:hypothetical protein
MELNFWHAGSAHSLIMAMMEGKNFEAKNQDGTVLSIRPRTEVKDFLVRVTGGESAFKEVTLPVHLSGSFIGSATMTVKVTVHDGHFLAASGEEGRKGPCMLSFS